MRRKSTGKICRIWKIGSKMQLRKNTIGRTLPSVMPKLHNSSKKIAKILRIGNSWPSWKIKKNTSLSKKRKYSRKWSISPSKIFIWNRNLQKCPGIRSITQRISTLRILAITGTKHRRGEKNHNKNFQLETFLFQSLCKPLSQKKHKFQR